MPLIPIIGGMIIGGVGNALGDLAIQAGINAWSGKDIWDKNCYDWDSVKVSAALGAVGGGLGVANKLRGVANSVDNIAPTIKLGSRGGPTAGRRFSERVRKQAKDADPTSTCVYCAQRGKGTHVDHAASRASGGNATPENAQLACPHCNLSKGAGDFPKNPPPDYVGPWPPLHWPR